MLFLFYCQMRMFVIDHHEFGINKIRWRIHKLFEVILTCAILFEFICRHLTLIVHQKKKRPTFPFRKIERSRITDDVFPRVADTVCNRTKNTF